MPLWTTAISSWLTCGCALAGVGGAVRRPARVRDARVPVDARRVAACAARSATRAVLTKPLQAAVDDREPGRVVAAILEPADALDQDRNDVFARDRADDTAHGV